MGAYDCWCAQKPSLREALSKNQDATGVAYAVRHALSQVEQNTMAEKNDDLLRQQTGILFQCCKNAASLLDVPMTTQVWALQTPNKPAPRARLPLWIIAGLVQGAIGVYGYAAKQWLLCLLALAAFALALIAALQRPKKSAPPEPSVKTTLRPDTDKLFQVIDAQMQAIDRYVNDFQYLNENVSGNAGTPDHTMAAMLSDILEALQDCDEDTRQGAEEAARRMLTSLGLEAVSYSDAVANLFTVLPSKNETKTLVPAIVAEKDRQLLKRGVAAVQMVSDG